MHAALRSFGAYTLCDKIAMKTKRTTTREARPKPRAAVPTVPTQAAVMRRSVLTQSPVTYKTSLQQPRFLPLAEGAHGAWVEPYLSDR